MKIISRLILTLFFACIMSACGTFHSLSGDAENKIYSGVRYDVEKMKQVKDDESVHTGFFRILDLPFSLIADTIVLPYTVVKALMASPSDL